MSLLQVSGISKQQQGAFILKDISFTQQKFQKIAIAGETGSGKSTLMKIVGGLAQADSGTVFFDGVRVKGSEEVLIPGFPGIAYLSQYFELRNNYRVEEILAYANKLVEEDANRIYEVCRVTHLLKRRTEQLSGGEKQRIALARLLTTAPRMLLMDEPFSNLDMIHKSILKSVINDLVEELEITCMLISHDAQDLLSWADEVMLMKDGVIVQQGTPQEVYYKPVNEYAAGLLGKYNIVQGRFVRPEDVVLGDKKGMKGIVNRVLFFGGYNEVEVLAAGQVITVNTGTAKRTKGEEVYLS